jgi:hypothetical protein
MATKTEVLLIDDLDGESPADETIRFALDGKDYEIDLSEYHAKALRENLADFVHAARKAGPRAANAATSVRRTHTDREDLVRIREWASANGFNVAARGRISASVMEAYRAAH